MKSHSDVAGQGYGCQDTHVVVPDLVLGDEGPAYMLSMEEKRRLAERKKMQQEFLPLGEYLKGVLKGVKQ